MSRKKCAACLLAGMALLIVPSGRAAAEENLKIGVVSSLFRDTSPSLIDFVSRPLMVLIQSQTGMTGKMLVADSDALAQQLKEHKVQLAVFHGFEFAWVRRNCPELKPLVTVVARQPRLHALLVVRKDCPAASCADLKGQLLALPAFSRGHLHLYLERRSPAPGSDPNKFFARVRRPADADNALDDVVDGMSQAALVEQADLDDYQKGKPGRFARLRVLHQSETFPPSVIAYAPGGLDEATLKKVREGLLGADRGERGKELLGMCRITGFAEVPADYEQLLTDIFKAYPPPAKKDGK